MRDSSRSPGGSLVYSTEGGRMCPACRHPLGECQCRNANPPSKAAGKVRVSRESKGRGGKTVTLVHGLALEPIALAVLARELRNACGCGGTLKDGVVEVQGEHVDRVTALLRARGLVR